jgi:hypothetical protein
MKFVSLLKYFRTAEIKAEEKLPEVLPTTGQQLSFFFRIVRELFKMMCLAFGCQFSFIIYIHFFGSPHLFHFCSSQLMNIC